jgi:hypothetical protein
MRRLVAATVVCACVLSPFTVPSRAAGDDNDDRRSRVEVTVTNLTRAQTFTPVLVATHTENVRLFTLGQAASPELATLADEGDTQPLASLLAASRDVGAVVDSGPPPGGFVGPGESKTLVLAGGGRFDHVSVAAMLIPTNDGFFAVNAAPIPGGRASQTVFALAYDAGSERNDELCASIPGPDFAECGGPGGGAMVVGGEEGYVHVHAGIHGIGDFVASDRDWRNPVALVTIRRLR